MTNSHLRIFVLCNGKLQLTTRSKRTTTASRNLTLYRTWMILRKFICVFIVVHHYTIYAIRSRLYVYTYSHLLYSTYIKVYPKKGSSSYTTYTNENVYNCINDSGSITYFLFKCFITRNCILYI